MVLEDGRLGLLDFGSCRSFEGFEWELITRGVEGYREGGEKLRDVLRFGCDLSAKQAADPERMKFSYDLIEPYLAAKFDINLHFANDFIDQSIKMPK